MKKLVVFLYLFLLIYMTTACALINGSSGGKTTMIEPGDKIGNFLITIGAQGNFTYGFNINCSDLPAANTYSCNVKVGEAINVSTGIYDDTGSGKLDEVWAHSNYQMFINNRPVDLKAFGTIEYNHPQVGVIRYVNVVITASKAGEIIVRDSGIYDTGDPFASTSTYVFSEP